MSDIKNLLEETKEFMNEFDLKVENIIYIGTGSESCTWKQFCKLANKTYDSGYGGQEVLPILMIAFKDGEVMHRGEYDGSEWWQLMRPFVLPKNNKRLTAVIGDY